MLDEEKAPDVSLNYLSHNIEELYHEHKQLSVEQFKQHHGFEHVSEEYAQQLIKELYRLSILTYKIFVQNEFGTI